MKDYYALLGLEKNATKSEVKKNYRQLVTKFHPDKNSAPDAASKFIVITEAYEVLSDTKTRAQYDLTRWEVKKRQKESEYDFTIVKQPVESLRTRRRKAQQKRGMAYQQTHAKNQNQFKLASESFIVSGRYLVHILGVLLLLVLLYSASNQIKDAFDMSIGVGIGICIFIPAVMYWLYRLAEMTYFDFKQDIDTFSILYGLPTQKTIFYSFSAFLIILLSVLMILKNILS